MKEEGVALYHIANDQRERKSATKLSAAAERILLSREPQKLSVSLLSAEAGVSRTTFYRLFDEPDDVLKYMADETFHRILQGYVDLIDRAQKHDLSVPNPLSWYEEGVRKNGGVIAGLIRSGKSDVLRTAHKKALREAKRAMSCAPRTKRPSGSSRRSCSRTSTRKPTNSGFSLKCGQRSLLRV